MSEHFWVPPAILARLATGDRQGVEKTGVSFDPVVLACARLVAKREGSSVSAVIDEALCSLLAERFALVEASE